MNYKKLCKRLIEKNRTGFYKQLAYEVAVEIQNLKTENDELWEKVESLQSANGELIDKLQAIEEYVASLESVLDDYENQQNKKPIRIIAFWLGEKTWKN